MRLPSGHTVDMEIVRHPGSVVLLPMPQRTQIILIRQYRYTIDRWIWELPAGSLKPGEDPDGRPRASAKKRSASFPDRVERLRSFYPDARVLRRGDDLLSLQPSCARRTRFDGAQG